jgi:hypothetical protein
LYLEKWPNFAVFLGISDHNDLLPLDQVEPVQAYFQSAIPKKTAQLGHFFNYTFLFGKRLFLVGNT